jgi:hypothetical protein
VKGEVAPLPARVARGRYHPIMSDPQEFDLSDVQASADEANAFMNQLVGESDRGAALVGIAYLDELLARLFRARMLTEKTSEGLLEGFAPLSTFSSRIDVAYCLGWIGPETYRDLHLLRKPTGLMSPRIRPDRRRPHARRTWTGRTALRETADAASGFAGAGCTAHQRSELGLRRRRQP